MTIETIDEHAEITDEQIAALDGFEPGDDFYLVYDRKVFRYEVTETKIAGAEAVEYLDDFNDQKTATLMTCWPPGTNLKRLVVIGELSST